MVPYSKLEVVPANGLNVGNGHAVPIGDGGDVAHQVVPVCPGQLISTPAPDPNFSGNGYTILPPIDYATTKNFPLSPQVRHS